ncbi:MAG: bifunctional phosphopantothenoylcysteine decarboxylase/phosphopantothenate--cysteine ligase CoaBC [Chloroflexi bacterium]|nr:bifunctional phosphopantothenoylcysteine decarboxylase/phosphopantothenate--cysteine ligase CoaBC [Chloroflexota bacterium]
MILSGKRIVLGVTGSIAAYKAVYLASVLTKFGARLDAVMTPSAARFVGPVSFEGLTGRPAYTSVMQSTPEGEIAHVALGSTAQAVVIAPATAGTIARLAAGMASDILTATVLSSAAPVVIAPAMESEMYLSAVTRENLQTLQSRGATVIEPETGRLASGREGPGRMAEPDRIIDILRGVLGRGGPLAGRKIVVTAGGTRGQIDPVRFIGNPSSGRQGIAIAAEARDRGARVSLILGNHSHPPPAGVQLLHTLSYAAMRDAVLNETAGCDALIMAAAVNDFEAAQVSPGKIKKSGGGLTLSLTENPDFLLDLNDDMVKIGFAAETGELKKNAESKLAEKRLDAIVANDVTEEGAGFASPTNHVRILRRGAKWHDVPLGTKESVAEKIVDVVQDLVGDRAG